MTLAYAAMRFARKVHANQKRKYTGAPYFDHLAEVAGITMSAMRNVDPTQASIAVAWLHDCMEDHDVPFGVLIANFGTVVAEGVLMLSDTEVGNRAERKRLSRERLAEAPGWIQSIKCADLISNTSSIVQHDPKFAVTYLAEKRALLEVMTQADPGLRAIAMELAAH